MDINQLNCFISVAQTLNFSEAARRNYVSQSTVSRYISDLEKEFGVQLFTRSHRDVIITNEGKILLPYAIEIVDTLKKAKTVIKQIHEGGQGKINIACDITSLAFPSKCIADFNQHYPDITVTVNQLSDADGNSAITNSDFDFCFMPRDMVPENSGIESIVTHSDTLSVLASKNNPISKQKSISFCELANKKLLLFSETVCPILYMEIMDLLRTFHISPIIENTFDDMNSMSVAIYSGIGISVLPTSLAAYSSSKYTTVIPIDDTDTSVPYVMAWNKNISNPAAKLFMEAVKKYAKGEDNIYEI
ncbi:MAG: LysR family transcriptional regulator [Ruminococcus sp.]|nr:LysR family transcriptional regulator [Ruminococcus sp.]